MWMPETLPVTLIMMVITTLCWGSWANTQKMTQHQRFELFYWDYTLGILGTAVLLYSISTGDIWSARLDACWNAAFSGVLFNVANVLLVAAISMAGMSIAFPCAIGLALILGTVVNYCIKPIGSGALLAVGLLAILFAMYAGARAHRMRQKIACSRKAWIVILGSGTLMGTFYPILMQSMSGVESLDPYAALLYFAIGVVLVNFPVNYYLLRYPLSGSVLRLSDWWYLPFKERILGWLGGLIWMIGTTSNVLASSVAGPAIAYAFGQGATLIAACWGVFFWQEFKQTPAAKGWLRWMFIGYVTGLFAIGSATFF